MQTMSVHWRKLLLCVGVLYCVACAHRPEDLAPTSHDFTELAESIPPDEPRPPFIIGHGDTLLIRLSGMPETERLCRVGVDGRINYEPARELTPAAGFTQAELTKRLTVSLSRYFREPIVEVRLTEVQSARVIVLGQVTRPGAITLRGDERVIDLIARAGGPARSDSTSEDENIADLHGAMYVRSGRLLPVDLDALMHHGDMRFNISVHPGDYLYIPSTLDRQVFVLGAVTNADVYTFRSGMTVMRAIGLAGGYTRDAYADRLIVVRGSRSAPRAARIDGLAILQGRVADVPVQPGDIIYVPGRTSENPRFQIDTFNQSFLSGVALQYANDLYNQMTGKK
jgi:polysaccharide biosynthesis/export protein